MVDLQIQYRNHKAEIDAAMRDSAAAAQYILGPNVKAFEQEMAAYCGSTMAIGVGNCTDALHLALRALRIGPGDEVITTPFTFVATTEAIGMVGATPVFVDIVPETFNMDVAQVEAAITPRTRALLPVHLYGQPCDLRPLLAIAERHKLAVVEDAAQAIGARYQGRMVGTFGDLGCLSFFPSKNLGCFGDGGMVLTDNQELGARVEMLRRHGGKVKYRHTELGLNSRLDDLQAAILRVKLRHLTDWTEARRRLAYRYNELLQSVPGITTPVELPKTYCVYHQYTVRVKHRDQVQDALKKAGIQTMVYYPVPLHLQEVHGQLGLRDGAFPHAEEAARSCLSLPMFPEMTHEQQDRVVESLCRAVRDCSEGDV